MKLFEVIKKLLQHQMIFKEYQLGIISKEEAREAWNDEP